jgi:hypothetical protein
MRRYDRFVVPNLAKPAGIVASSAPDVVEADAVLDEFSAVLGYLSERQAELLACLRGLRIPRPEAATPAPSDGRPVERMTAPVEATPDKVETTPGTTEATPGRVEAADVTPESAGVPAPVGERGVGPRPRFAASRLRFVPPITPGGSRARKPKPSYDYFGDLDARIDRLGGTD